MISVSTIKSYMFCPLKLYFQSNIDEKTEEDYFVSKTLKDLRLDILDLFKKNLRHVKKGMEEEEIEKRLAIGINNQIKTTFDIIEEINEKNKNKNKETFADEENEENKGKEGNEENKRNEEKNLTLPNNMRDVSKLDILKKDDEIEFIDKNNIGNNIGNNINNDAKNQSDTNNPNQKKAKGMEKNESEEGLKELKKELINEINFNLKILSLKVAQSMKILDKEGDELQGLFFPSSMHNYLIRDIGLDLIGVIDKIEVEKGNYFPISLKSSKPPIKGVWDGDLMEAIANALLIEQEFNTYVTVAYVDYLKIGDRRSVIIDTDARKSFFKVLTHINKIVEDGEIPNVKTNLKKCENCEYKELCDKS